MTNFRYVGQYPGEGGCAFYCALAVRKASQVQRIELHPNFSAMEMSRDEVSAAISRIGGSYLSSTGTGANPHSLPMILRQVGLTDPYYESYPLARATPLAVVMRINEVYRRRPNTPGIIVPYFNETDSGTIGHVVVVWPAGDGRRNYWVYDPQGPPESVGQYDHLWLTSQQVFGQHVALTGSTRNLTHPYFAPSELSQLPAT